MQRYFVSNDSFIYYNDTISCVKISGSDYHHIKNVMRMKVSDKVYVCDENENCYICVIDSFSSDSVILNIDSKVESNVELPVEVTFCYGLVRREKTEEVLRRICELGCSNFMSVEMKRSIVRIKEKNNKQERFQTIAKEASEQSHRNKIMKVLDTVTFKDFIKLSSNYDLKLFAFEDEGRNGNYSLPSLLKGNYKNILVLTGPEGGFDLSEVETLKKNGFHAVGLGPRILRSETAPLYVMSAISYELELNK